MVLTIVTAVEEFAWFLDADAVDFTEFRHDVVTRITAVDDSGYDAVVTRRFLLRASTFLREGAFLNRSGVSQTISKFSDTGRIETPCRSPRAHRASFYSAPQSGQDIGPFGCRRVGNRHGHRQVEDSPPSRRRRPRWTRRWIQRRAVSAR